MQENKVKGKLYARETPEEEKEEEEVADKKKQKFFPCQACDPLIHAHGLLSCW